VGLVKLNQKCKSFLLHNTKVDLGYNHPLLDLEPNCPVFPAPFQKNSLLWKNVAAFDCFF